LKLERALSDLVNAALNARWPMAHDNGGPLDRRAAKKECAMAMHGL
jgi:hypothetical protein